MASVPADLARLAALAPHDLRLEFRRLHRAPPPASLSRDMLLRAIAYTRQERAHGGLSQTAKRMLAALGQKPAPGSGKSREAAAVLRSGVRLVREWGGRAHAVLVLDDGFDYQGQRYRSLTQIATLITGAHWSGPRFFAATQSLPKARRGRSGADVLDDSVPGHRVATQVHGQI